MYDPVGLPPPDEDTEPSGPMILLYIRNHGFGGRLLQEALPDSLGRPYLGVQSGYATAHVFGEVAFGFDRVKLDCAKGPTVNAVVVDCADHLPFNYYVAEVVSRVDRVSATSPDGRAAERELDQ
jgi:hypothetical protein